MAEIASSLLINVIGVILQIIKVFPRDASARTRDQEDALITLSAAYHATKEYYSFLSCYDRSNEKEYEIADKWYKVGVLLRKYDKNLANRLDLKSRFWRDGATWSDESIREAGIKLEEVWRAVNILLVNQG